MMKNQKKKMHHPKTEEKDAAPKTEEKPKEGKTDAPANDDKKSKDEKSSKAHLNGQKRFQPKSIWILQNRWRQSNTREENLLSMWQGSIHVSSQGQTLVR